MDEFSFRGVTMCTENSGLAAGTTTTYTCATFDYGIRGKGYTKTAVTNAATPTLDANTGAAFVALKANEGCNFLFFVNSSQTVSVAQSKIRKLSGEADGANTTFSNGLASYPNIPDDSCPFGEVLVRVGASGSAWTMGASNLSAVSNVAIEFQPLITLSDRPPSA